VRNTVLVIGGAGQVGIELCRLQWPDMIEINAPSSSVLDITNAESVAAYFASLRPKCVINCAAYTAVDKAEEDVASAFLVNALGAAHLAEAARRTSAPIVHVSTDYVFDGSGNRPYLEKDPTGPLSAYGASKLAGELAVQAANMRHAIVRTAWVLSAHRSNFIKTMLRLSEAMPELRVVADQRSCPTSATDIAGALQLVALRMMDDEGTPTGIYHFVNQGEASWHELAEHIFAWREAHGAARPKVVAIPTSDYPTAARRPANSRLDTRRISETFGIRPRPWQAAIDDILLELAGTAGETQD
jgi:dTDP-4-dehydrorhamnose reductase